MDVTHWIAVDGATLAVEYRPQADGRAPLVFLHAGVTDGRLWDAAMAAAAGRRSALRVDRRGFGQTRIDRPMPHAMVADLLAVLDALALPRVELIGCSQGGRLAIDFALGHPARVAGLTLVAPAVTGAPAPVLDANVQAQADAIEAAEQAGDIDAVNRLEARLWLDGPAQPEGRVGGAARALFLAMNRIALASPPAGDLIGAPPAWPRLAALPQPVRLIWGDQDLPHLVARCRQMAALIPGVHTWELAGMAHLPPLEAPAAFNEVLKAAGVLDG
jgi:pimeloyl-ACP methyl ester carboxylesterase